MYTTISKIISLYSGLSIASGLILAPILGQMSSSIIPILFNSNFIEDIKNKNIHEIHFTFRDHIDQPMYYLYGFLWGIMMPSYMIFNHLTNISLPSIVLKINCVEENNHGSENSYICTIDKNKYVFSEYNANIADINLCVNDLGVLTDKTIGNIRDS